MSTVEQRRARWEQICREFRQSGMTQTAFCKERGIAPSSLGYWLNPARGTTGGDTKPKKHCTDLVPVGTISMGTQSVLRLRIGEEVVAELDLPSDDEVIRQVLRAARSL